MSREKERDWRFAVLWRASGFGWSSSDRETVRDGYREKGRCFSDDFDLRRGKRGGCFGVLLLRRVGAAGLSVVLGSKRWDDWWLWHFPIEECDRRRGRRGVVWRGFPVGEDGDGEGKREMRRLPLLVLTQQRWCSGEGLVW
ncbi:hypothetical protein HAX54_047775 [Datura stramonium]|uniref:Uncharacterized protein n=1 Tax=Datura stramonium TaxID=4076 RepID=A0ABS8WKG7_DATST|nr:hypothetical protein [Datura stramonium]